MKKYIIIMMCLLMLPVVLASSASITSENTTFWASIFNGTTQFDADAATITILNPNGSIFVVNDSMTPISIGVFKYNNFPNNSGNYYINVDFSKNGTFILSADDTMYVAKSVDEMLVNITIILILFLIGLGFAWFAERSENFIWYIFGGIWFLVIAPVAVGVLIQINALFSFISIGFFWLIAIMMLWEALDQSMGNSTETE